MGGGFSPELSRRGWLCCSSRMEADRRQVPEPNADERTTLTGWLDWQRATVRLKCAGLDDSAARRQFIPTSPAMTIAGIVRHLADAERHWLVRSFLGEPASPEPRLWGESDEPLHRSLDAYDAQCERSRQITAAYDLGDTERYAPDGLPLVSLRWILGHLIEETARHLGHLDILRELTDGARGY